MKVSDIQPASYNPRKITDRQLEMLHKSMSEFGDLSGFVLNIKTGNLVGGHQRLKNIPENAIIEKTKLKKISRTGTIAEGYIIADGERWSYREVEWDLYKEKMANIAANKHGGSFDDEKLSQLLSEINSLPEIDFDLTGFESYEYDKLLESLKEEEQEDSIIPEINNDNIKTKIGDLFLLDKHRLLCGDSTKKEDIEKLMDGKKANMIFTDPPYGVNLNEKNLMLKGYGRGKDWGDIENDVDKDKLLDFLKSIFINLKDAINNKCAWYIWYAQTNHTIFEQALEPLNFLIHNLIIWNKPRFVIGRKDYHWAHEPCIYGWIRGNRPPWYGSRNQKTVWNLNYDGNDNQVNKNHPTSKPEMLSIVAIKNNTLFGDIVLDPFLGSGSTLMGAEKTKRICYGIEKSPKYCDVIIARWEKYTGKKVIKC